MSGELEQRIAQLSPAKRALLELLQNGASRSVAEQAGDGARARPAASAAPLAVASAEPVSGPLVPIKPGADRPPLFCVHPVSGSSYCYVELTRLLDRRQSVYGIEAAGFDDDQTPIRSLPELANRYLSAIDELRLTDGLYLLGWSVGGVIAFDMAQRLAAAGAAPHALILIDSMGRQTVRIPPEREVLRRFMRELLQASARPMLELDAILASQPESAGPGHVLTKAVGAGLTPPEMSVEFLERRYRVFRANLEAYVGYGVEGGYDGRTVLIKGSRSPAASIQWPAVLSNAEIHTVAGDHHSIWNGESLLALGAIVQRSLDLRPRAQWP